MLRRRSKADGQHQNGDQQRSPVPEDGLHEVGGHGPGVLRHTPIERADDGQVHQEIEHCNKHNGRDDSERIFRRGCLSLRQAGKRCCSRRSRNGDQGCGAETKPE